MQQLTVFHGAFLYVALLAALLGGITGALKAGRQGAVAGAVSGVILGFVLSTILGPAANYLTFSDRPDNWAGAVTFFLLALAGGVLGGMTGLAVIELLKDNGRSFPNHPAGFPCETPGPFRPDTIEAPDVRKATQKLQETRYRVINIDETGHFEWPQSTDIGAVLSGLVKRIAGWIKRGKSKK